MDALDVKVKVDRTGFEEAPVGKYVAQMEPFSAENIKGDAGSRYYSGKFKADNGQVIFVNMNIEGDKIWTLKNAFQVTSKFKDGEEYSPRDMIMAIASEKIGIEVFEKAGSVNPMTGLLGEAKFYKKHFKVANGNTEAPAMAQSFDGIQEPTTQKQEALLPDDLNF